METMAESILPSSTSTSVRLAVMPRAESPSVNETGVVSMFASVGASLTPRMLKLIVPVTLPTPSVIV